MDDTNGDKSLMIPPKVLPGPETVAVAGRLKYLNFWPFSGPIFSHCSKFWRTQCKGSGDNESLAKSAPTVKARNLQNVWMLTCRNGIEFNLASMYLVNSCERLIPPREGLTKIFFKYFFLQTPLNPPSWVSKYKGKCSKITFSLFWAFWHTAPLSKVEP